MKSIAALGNTIMSEAWIEKGQAVIAGLPEDLVEKLDLVFYGDVDRAVLKTLEI